MKEKNTHIGQEKSVGFPISSTRSLLQLLLLLCVLWKANFELLSLGSPAKLASSQTGLIQGISKRSESMKREKSWHFFSISLLILHDYTFYQIALLNMTSSS